jgi:hypothetical protein
MSAALKKKWTVLVWMAGDNDLETAADRDIAEMKTVGSTADIEVVVQLDRLSDDKTRRYHLRAGTTADQDVVQTLGETNAGDPAVAADFFSWGIANYPAEHVLAVLWNHGSGIDETDIYRSAKSIGLTVDRRTRSSRRSIPPSHARRLASSRFRRSLFSTTIDQALLHRAIAIDDTNRDFLDNVELKKVLTTVMSESGRTLDIVGFDACLMSMVEVAYQIRPTADFVVASEESEPTDGWPYDTILADLAAKPGMTPADLGKTIVKRYVASYKTRDVTLALLDLGRGPALAKAVKDLAAQLEAAIASPAEYAAVTKAAKAAQKYDIPDFLDFYDFCDQLTQRVKSASVRKAANATRKALLEESPFVAAEAHKGATVDRSHGAAIYFPMGRANVVYDRLDFAKVSGWGRFVAAYSKA